MIMNAKLTMKVQKPFRRNSFAKLQYHCNLQKFIHIIKTQVASNTSWTSDQTETTKQHNEWNAYSYHAI